MRAYGLHQEASHFVGHHQPPPPIRHLHSPSLGNARPLQVDKQSRDEAAPEPAWYVRHDVPPLDAIRWLSHHGVRPLILPVHACSDSDLLRPSLFLVLCRRGDGKVVQANEDGSLDGQHGGDEVLAVP